MKVKIKKVLIGVKRDIAQYQKENPPRRYKYYKFLYTQNITCKIYKVKISNKLFRFHK